MPNCPFDNGQMPNHVVNMQKTFADAFNDHLERTGLPVTELARKSGVNKDALYKLKYRKTKNMTVDEAIRVAAAFGETVEEFMGLSPAQIREGLAEQVARLSPREQAILEASIAAILAQRDESEETSNGA